MSDNRTVLVTEFFQALSEIRKEYPELAEMKDYIIGVLAGSAFGWTTRHELKSVMDLIKSQAKQIRELP